MAYQAAIVKAFARVVYATRELGMGLVFINIEPEDERTLGAWLSELSVPVQP
jgi:hypothetical protein